MEMNIQQWDEQKERVWAGLSGDCKVGERKDVFVVEEMQYGSADVERTSQRGQQLITIKGLILGTI